MSRVPPSFGTCNQTSAKNCMDVGTTGEPFTVTESAPYCRKPPPNWPVISSQRRYELPATAGTNAVDADHSARNPVSTEKGSNGVGFQDAASRHSGDRLCEDPRCTGSKNRSVPAITGRESYNTISSAPYNGVLQIIDAMEEIKVQSHNEKTDRRRLRERSQYRVQSAEPQDQGSGGS